MEAATVAAPEGAEEETADERLARQMEEQQERLGTAGQEPAPPVEEIRVDGTTQLGMFDAGGKQPTTATIALTGGKVMLLDGKAFRKGDVIEFSGTAVVREVSQSDKADPKTGIVVSASQDHRAQITDLVVKGVVSG